MSAASPAAAGPRAGELAKAAAAPLVCGIILLVLLATWVAGGGGGAVSRVRITITAATVPMAAATAGRPAGPAGVYLTMQNLTGTTDTLLSATSPAAASVVVTRSGLRRPAAAASGITVPPHATVSLSPFGPDLVLLRPHGLAAGEHVLLRLRFRHAGLVTVQAAVTPPGTP